MNSAARALIVRRVYTATRRVSVRQMGCHGVGDGGNDRADELDLVQWGKEEGPYESSRGSEKRVESRGSGVLHRGHK